MTYSEWKHVLTGHTFPVGIVDLDAFDANVRRIAELAGRQGKPVRLATKSVRVPDLIHRILEVGKPWFRGLMCYSVREARFLAGLGFQDFLVAYPTTQEEDLRAASGILAGGGKITLMVDSVEQIGAIEQYWRGDIPVPVCIDVDLSYRPLGLYIGVRRSPIQTLEQFKAVFSEVFQRPKFDFKGVMGYEAQIAGLPDRNPFAPLLNPLKHWIRYASAKDVARRRKEIAEYLKGNNIRFFFNGGGTGSLQTTLREDWLTEVTAGSGFLQSHLFDYYSTNLNEPAIYFALPVTRKPADGIVTCQSGGFISSGAIGGEKAPLPAIPEGLKLLKDEGCGEVQTPLKVPRGIELGIGDPVLFRPSKAGEIAEHFTEYLLKQGDQIVGKAKTYRGLNQLFY